MAAATIGSRLLRSSLLANLRDNVLNNHANLAYLRDSSILRTLGGNIRRNSSESTANKFKTQTNTSNESLLISDSCVKRLKAIQSEDEFLRISVDGGGCSGFQYTFALEASLQPDDCLIIKDGVRVVVDEISLEYVKGSTVDYQQELIRSSFRIVSNPRAEQGCSCGASFAVKL